jgi:hypothetical protein
MAQLQRKDRAKTAGYERNERKNKARRKKRNKEKERHIE